MKNKGLEFILKTVSDRFDKWFAENAVTREVLAILKIYQVNLARILGFNGQFIKSDECVFLLGEVKILDKRGGGTEQNLEFIFFGDKTGKTECIVFGRLVLRIGGFVALINDD